MEIFKSNKKNSKWNQKIDFIKGISILIISFVLFFLFFNFIGGSNNTDRAIITSVISSILMFLISVFSDLIENRNRVFILFDDDELGYIEVHQEFTGRFIRSDEFESIIEKEDIEKIYKKNHLYEGIDKGVIEKVISIKKKKNRTIVKATVKSKEWKSAGKITISNIYIVNKNYNKKIIIPNDYDKYNKLCKIMEKMKG